MGLSGTHHVPEYIRLIAQGEFTAAYMVNRESNVFPGILAEFAIDPVSPPAGAAESRKNPLPFAA